MTAFGIPYAYGDIDPDGVLVRICPVCGARCREVTDVHGEQETNAYGGHYAANHEKEEDGNSTN